MTSLSRYTIVGLKFHLDFGDTVEFEDTVIRESGLQESDFKHYALVAIIADEQQLKPDEQLQHQMIQDAISMEKIVNHVPINSGAYDELPF